MDACKDDLDGREADLGITFGIDGVLYRIRLSVDHAADLYDLLASYREQARRVGLVHLDEPEICLPAVTFASRGEAQAAARDWARARELPVAAYGDVADAIWCAFELERMLEATEQRQ
ncbi:Lsr2 family protein [Glycomyces sp. A-F 0318]|uniref:Lsr2 dimerization domain-containing protein n=1 Tax=Glycomyces amatae TaxID=2881355 RepID=UPI001E3F948A|nr:Lsr2 family protein [Glycomyces amatae]